MHMIRGNEINNLLTSRLMRVPNAMERKRPRKESERKAPKIGRKFDMAPHKNIILIAGA